MAPRSACERVEALLKSFSIPGRLPETRQAAASECGLACLAMVASFYGRQTDLGENAL